MPALDVHNQQGQVVRQEEISADLAQAPVHQAALHQVVVAQLANRRRGTASTKTRAEVRGSGRKLYRQKGTGRARMGMNRTPVRVGGGVAFGPKPRSYRQQVPKKVKRLALRAAIADKIQSQELVLVESLHFERPRTKELVAFLKQLPIDGQKILIVLAQKDDNIYYSSRNLPYVHVTTADLLNVYDVLWHDALVVTQEALRSIEARCGSPETANATESGVPETPTSEVQGEEAATA